MMIPNPNLILYACISKGTMILAEFNSNDADLGALAVKCLEKTPSLHSMFSHTIRNKTYTFLIDGDLVYFGIFDEKLENSKGLSFLKSVRKAFDEILLIDPIKRLDTLKSHCFQGELNPVFQQLRVSPAELGLSNSPGLIPKYDHSGSSLDSSREKKVRSLPWLGDVSNGLKKKKRRLFGEPKDHRGDLLAQSKVGLSDDCSNLCREFPMAMHKIGLSAGDSGHKKVKQAWKKQVWVVLSLDLIVCTILFVIWLCVCRGFKCVDG